jgi:hypothetical protein
MVAADLDWQFAQDSSGAFSNVSTLRFKNANNNVNDLNDPLVRPTSGTNYSFEKALRIYITTANDATVLSALRVKLNVSSPGATLSPGPNDVAQAYDFRAAYTQPVQGSGGLGGIGGPMPGKEGTLNTAEVTWTGATDHNLSSDGEGVQWVNSEYLYCQLEVGPGSGGTMSWQTIAVYNEV